MREDFDPQAQPEVGRDGLLSVGGSDEELAGFLLGEPDLPPVVLIMVLHLHCRSFRETRQNS